MFDLMVRSWRNLWNIGEFPFYYCQIAPYNYGGKSSAYMREAQAKGMQTTPNTGMAVLMDANSPNVIHPVKKKDAGERLAFWALAKTYGMEEISYRSPEYKEMTIEGSVATVTFDMFNSQNGLTSYGTDILKFQIAGANKQFYPATATLSDNKVHLSSSNVSQPVAVRYCWDDTSATEIFSIDGNLPVSSFRTDTW
jgi:sialate O-acetylesterase